MLIKEGTVPSKLTAAVAVHPAVFTTNELGTVHVVDMLSVMSVGEPDG